MGHTENEDDLLAQEIQIESESKARRQEIDSLEKERLRTIERRQEIAQERIENATLAHQTGKSDTKSPGLSASGCLVILAIIATATFWLVRSCEEEPEDVKVSSITSQVATAAESQAEQAVDLRALEQTVYDWIKNHEHYDVTQLSLSRTDTPLHYEGIITWNRYGRSFTNMLVVQYFLENGGITWHVDESQEELDYVTAHEGAVTIPTMKMTGTVNGKSAHLYIESVETKIVGFYYFDCEGAQHKRNLGGDYNRESSQLKLLETNADDATISVFDGQLNGSSTYSGSYTNILNSVNAQFEFHKTSN